MLFNAIAATVVAFCLITVIALAHWSLVAIVLFAARSYADMVDWASETAPRQLNAMLSIGGAVRAQDVYEWSDRQITSLENAYRFSSL